jgi:hypothetical protein
MTTPSAQDTPSALPQDYEAWFRGEQGKPYGGMWEFGRAAWNAALAAPPVAAEPARKPNAVEDIAAFLADVTTDARGRKTYSFDSWGIAAFARELSENFHAIHSSKEAS